MTHAIANLHGLGPPHPWVDADEARYWLEPESFARVLDGLLSGGQPFGLTFDDGNISDFTIAMPMLRARGLAASFFVCAERIGQPGYLGVAELRALAGEGFTIGVHGGAHVAWRGLGDGDLEREVVGATSRIAEAIGAPVTEAAIPFGTYDRRVLRALDRAGILRAYTSDGDPRLLGGRLIPRISLRSDIGLDDQILRLVRRSCLAGRIGQEVRLLAKSLR